MHEGSILGNGTHVALAGVVYRMLKDKVEYAPLSVGEYEKQYEAQQLKYLQKKAAKLGYQLVPGPGTPTQKAASRGDRLLDI